ncbi:hypothetical protein BKA70DRAFT_1449292 [Coprinopsis sp. MPI-PUGE-AT-0042]|nr:hypothetical protein BKA70DRAFT_1449292 [Coprinopsis sp. MPI-PUGE-AT-0042]
MLSNRRQRRRIQPPDSTSESEGDIDLPLLVALKEAEWTPIFAMRTSLRCAEHSPHCLAIRPEIDFRNLGISNDEAEEPEFDEFGVELDKPPSMVPDMPCAVCHEMFHVWCIQEDLREQGAQEEDINLVDAEHFDVHMLCSACLMEDGEWEDRSIGAFVMITPPGCQRFYPYEIKSRKQDTVTLQLYERSTYLKPDKTPSTSLIRMSLHDCIRALLRDRFAYSDKNVGGMIHPQWLNRDGLESGGYQNEALTKVLDESFDSILDIVQKKTLHPITELFDKWMVGKKKNSKMEQQSTMLFRSNFFIPILPCDTSLTLPILHRMQQALKAKRYDVDRAVVISETLFHLVIGREYLGLGPESDMQLFALACSASMHSQLLSSTFISKADVIALQDAFNGHFCCVLTRDEKALLPSVVQEDLSYLSVMTRDTSQPWESGGLLVQAKVQYSKTADVAGMAKARLGFKAMTSSSMPLIFQVSEADTNAGVRRSTRRR